MAADKRKDLPTGVELETVTRLLERMVEDRSLLAEVPEPVRRRLLMAAGQLSRPERTDLRKLRREIRKFERKTQKAHDGALVSSTEMRQAQRERVFQAPPPRALPPAPASASASDAAPDQRPELKEPRHCYVCKQHFTRLHFFYDAMCQPCAELNYAKRHQTAPLAGQVALITGARLKIGYHTALKLLRAGAHVIATTRFPHDAALRFAREPDHAEFAHRIEVHGLDLRHAPSVELFSAALEGRLGRLDILINNAAQTVRRPPGFYSHLVDTEQRALSDLPPAAARILAAHDELCSELRGAASTPGPAEDGVMAWRGGSSAVGLYASAALSQLPCAPGDDAPEAAFPIGHVDQDLQQVDLRQMNSWRLTAADVSVPELLEVHLVNAIAPFILVSKLKPLMMKTPGSKHVVNVSAMEAQFSRRKKTDKHPHTNMAKAALNMLTRTSAVDYVQHAIHMNSVDTGWVTDEDPLIDVARKQYVHAFHPPLDIIDGAARILDPIFVGHVTGEHPWGIFFKDYKSVPW